MRIILASINVGPSPRWARSTASRAFGEVLAAVLHFGRRGVGPEIALDEEHQAEILYGGEVDAFVGDAGGLASVADVGHDGDMAALQARAEGDAGEDRN
jgi:hypothetical protein